MAGVFLVRHAAPLVVEGTPADRWPLTERGREEAVAMGRRLAAARSSAAVWSSPEHRARDTATLAFPGLMDSDAVLAGHVVDALHALRNGRIQVSIDRVLPLNQVNEAFDLLAQQQVQGKLLLDLRS